MVSRAFCVYVNKKAHSRGGSREIKVYVRNGINFINISKADLIPMQVMPK